MSRTRDRTSMAVHCRHLFWIVLIGGLSCTPPPPKIDMPSPEPFLETNPWQLHSNEQIQSEIKRLEQKLLFSNPVTVSRFYRDTTSARTQIFESLFDLYIHANNRQPQYEKAYFLIDVLLKSKRYRHTNAYYRDWKQVLDMQRHEKNQYDSLLNEFSLLNKKHESFRSQLQKRGMEIDSLILVLKRQQETIQKLQELDLKMEQQRSRIP
ncbi:MAG: hypothetical protein JW795_22525 [Chitinivibrionales bacterium]|nr:hypothetical protein [Chitinivibrionales bacterium]